MALSDTILTLTRQLYPKGRAFKMPFGGYFESLHKGLAISEAQAFSDATSILFDVLPDNDNFTDDDAAAWEKRLGLIPGSVLADRKAAIQRKINFPGAIKARQSHLYLEDQLQAAGFSVYVYENRFSDGMGGYYTQDPITLSGGGSSVEHGDFQHGGTQHGGFYENIIVNHIDETLDFSFAIGDNLRSTFFIGGNTLGSFANVDASRKDEFRQLILKIKPVQTVGFLFINYV